MKSKVLTFFNVILGVLAMLFAGCHSGKKAVKPKEAVCMYAGPAQMGQLDVRDNDSIPDNTVVPGNEELQGTEGQEVEPQEEKAPRPQPVKYGPRPM